MRVSSVPFIVNCPARVAQFVCSQRRIRLQKFSHSLFKEYEQNRVRCYSKESAVNDIEKLDCKINVSLEGSPLPKLRQQLLQAKAQLSFDLQPALQQVLQLLREEPHTSPKSKFILQHKGAIEASAVICDAKISRYLNWKFRDSNYATDVLSFEIDTEDEDLDVFKEFGVEMPDGQQFEQSNCGPLVLGELFICADVAFDYAQIHRHDLLQELRVLLVHGLLHLVGYDHERGAKDEQIMKTQENRVLSRLGWNLSGLVQLNDEQNVQFENVQLKWQSTDTPKTPVFMEAPDIKLVLIDMDGTLLDSNSQIRPSSVQAINQVLKEGNVNILLATGKARPAAIKACEAVGLAGIGKLVSEESAGIFLQGLSVYNTSGQLVPGPELTEQLVKSAFEYAARTGVALSAFTGDTCATLKMQPEIMTLHDVYYEPLAKVYDSVDELLAQEPSVKKLLFMSDESVIKDQVVPYWTSVAGQYDASTLQAVSTMLELVPKDMNKWVGIQLLMQNLGLSSDSVLTIGDGLNDAEMTKNCIGVAMGNAVEETLAAADVVVSTNDQDGVQEALSMFVIRNC